MNFYAFQKLNFCPISIISTYITKLHGLNFKLCISSKRSSGVRRIYFSRGRKFILGRAEKKSGGAESPEGREKVFCPPCFCFCPPGRIRFCPWGRTYKRGGRKPLYSKSINTNISHQFFDYTITFVN